MTAAVLSGAEESDLVTDRPTSRTLGPAEYTRFERARILGARALQVSLGAPILTDVPTGLVDPVAIAELEFAAGRIPITVRRNSAS